MIVCFGDRSVSTQLPSKLPSAASSARRWIVGLVLAAAVASVWLSAWALNVDPRSPLADGPLVTHLVSRGDVRVTVTERGTVESSKNTEIKCRVRGGYGGRGGESTVTFVIPTGTIVSEGDELLRLDTKVLDETVSLGKTDTNNARAALARAEADLAKAEIAVDAYLNGSYRSQMKSLEKELDEKQRNLRIAQQTLDYSEEMFERGFVNELEFEGNRYALTQAQLELNITETTMDVLSRLTKAMELETLNGQRISARARLEGRKAGVALEQGRLDLAKTELENCVIRAPQSGLVIYPSTAKWKDTPDVTVGASVRNNQVLLIMPDLTRMQIKVGIHESIVDRVKVGQKVRVELPDRVIRTEVATVASVASPAGWWNGNSVSYDAVIRLPNLDGLRPGMSAEVEVVVAKHEDVLNIPVAAVVETEQGHHCWVASDLGQQRRSLVLGESNGEVVVVESGVSESERVVLHPLDSIAEAKQMVLPTMVHRVERGDLRATLTEQGTLESANNTQIKCRVRGASTVNWVIESGTVVQEGDELVRLENKQIEDFLHERTKYAFLSRDAAIGFRAQATRAGLAISEYLEGRFPTQLMTLEKDLAVAEESLRTAMNMHKHAKTMHERGYVSELELEQRKFAVTEAKLSAEIVRNSIDVLKRFTKEEELITLRGNWESAKAAAHGHEEVLRMDETRIALAKKEIERSVIRAARGGLVIYPEGEEWKDAPDIAEGATVHKDQVLLLMPDLSKMQVRVGIYESMADEIKPGMKATVRVPGKTIVGQVSSVASAAQPAAWWTGNIVKYDAIIELPTVEGLKPGMSAEVGITLAEHRDVLTIPIAAVVDTDDGSYCWVGTIEQAQRRAVVLGDSNDKAIVVRSGLQEGERVVLYPASHFQDAESK